MLSAISLLEINLIKKYIKVNIQVFWHDPILLPFFTLFTFCLVLQLAVIFLLVIPLRVVSCPSFKKGIDNGTKNLFLFLCDGNILWFDDKDLLLLLPFLLSTLLVSVLQIFFSISSVPFL